MMFELDRETCFIFRSRPWTTKHLTSSIIVNSKLHYYHHHHLHLKIDYQLQVSISPFLHLDMLAMFLRVHSGRGRILRDCGVVNDRKVSSKYQKTILGLRATCTPLNQIRIFTIQN